MSLHALRSALRYSAEHTASRWEHIRVGDRTSYDPVNGLVKVMLQPEGVETGWIPYMPQWVGNGWGLFAPPGPGSQCVVGFLEGVADHGIVLGAIPSLQAMPPTVPDGECWLIHQDGPFVKLTNTPALLLGDGHGATLSLMNGEITSAGAWTHTGAFSATGEVTAMSQGSAVKLSVHKHPLSGGPATGAPLPG